MSWYDPTDEYMGETFWLVYEFMRDLQNNSSIVAEVQTTDPVIIDEHTKQILYRLGSEVSTDDRPVIVAVTCYTISDFAGDFHVSVLVAFEKEKVKIGDIEIEPPDFRSRKNTKWKKLFRDQLLKMFSEFTMYPYMKAMRDQFELATKPTKNIKKGKPSN